jgi:hypothetical protein
MPLQLADLDSQRFSIGKAAVFYAPAWDFASNLHAELEFLGFTEGEVSVAINETYNRLTLPEYTGDAPHKEYVQGEAPEITLPLFAADPDLRAILSPTGSASGGRKRQQPVVTYTVALIPEELFLDTSDPTSQADLTLAATGTGWTLGGDALTTEQEALLGVSGWFWRVRFGKPNLIYRHEDGGKVVVDVTGTVLYQVEAPNGHRLYTLGDPYEAGIDITTGLITES